MSKKKTIKETISVTIGFANAHGYSQALDIVRKLSPVNGKSHLASPCQREGRNLTGTIMASNERLLKDAIKSHNSVYGDTNYIEILSLNR